MNLTFPDAANTATQLYAAFVGRKKVIAHAAQEAIKEAGKQLKNEGRANIRAALGARFANAWRVKIYPERGESIDAAAYAYHKIPYAWIFEQGGTILPRRGGLLWIPLSNTPFGGRKRLPPAKLVAEGIKLVSMRHHGKPLLGAVVPASFRGKPAKDGRIRLSSLKRAINRAAKRGSTDTKVIPMFFGVSSVTLKRKIDVALVAAQIRARLGGLYFSHLEAN